MIKHILNEIFNFFFDTTIDKPKGKLENRVRCVDDRNWNSIDQSLQLNLGYIYEVKQTYICPNCRTKWYDIGCRSLGKRTTHDCSLREKTSLPGENIKWAYATRFTALVDGDLEKFEELKVLNEAIKGETKSLLKEEGGYKELMGEEVDKMKREIGLESELILKKVRK